MDMKTSITVSPIVLYDAPEEGLKLIKEAGFDALDFSFTGELSYHAVVTGDLDSIFSQSVEDVRALYKPIVDAIKEQGLEVAQAHAPYPTYTRNSEMDDLVFESIVKSMAVCQDLGCPYIVVHPNFGDYSWRLDSETQWAVNKEFYTRLIPYSKEYGVGICLENMFTSYNGRLYSAICSDADEAIAYIDALNEIAGFDCFSFCYDTGHQTLLGLDFRENLRKLNSRVKVLHIHDNDGRNDSHLAPYMGVSDWEAFIEGLRDISFSGAISFEVRNVFGQYPKELWPEQLALIAATGRYFAKRLAK